MSNKITWVWITILVLVSVILGTAGCVVEEDSGAGERIKVGLSFSDFETERWKPEEVLMTQLLEAKGYEVLSEEAGHDVELQNAQIAAMVAQGAQALLIVAEDGDAAAAAASEATEQDVIVIAYDRLVKSTDIAAYVSFNNVEVGRQQALGVMEALAIENWDVDTNGPARVVQMVGAPRTTTRSWCARDRTTSSTLMWRRARSRSWRIPGLTTGMRGTRGG